MLLTAEKIQPRLEAGAKKAVSSVLAEDDSRTEVVSTCQEAYTSDMQDVSRASCTTHGLASTVSNRSRRRGCGKRPCFGLPGDRRPSICMACKGPGMVNMRDRRCECGKQPRFGLP